MNNTVKNLVLWSVILVVILLLFKFVDVGKNQTSTVSLTEFLDKTARGEVASVMIRGSEVRGYPRGAAEGSEPTARAFTPAKYDIVPALQKNNVKISAEEPRDGSLLVLFLQAAPILFLIGLWDTQ